jgi:TetR/AcrR family transcriptional regulator, ethionamide resistance regulator
MEVRGYVYVTRAPADRSSSAMPFGATGWLWGTNKAALDPSAMTSLPTEPSISGKASRSVRRPDVERRLIAAVSRICADGTAFSDVSIARLVREEKLARATFYLYFPDRTAFVLRLMDHVREQLDGSLSRMWTAVMDSRVALDAALRDFVATYVHEYPLIAAVNSSAGDAVVARRLGEEMLDYIDLGVSAIKLAQQRGRVSADLPPFETASALVWMVEVTCYRLAGDSDDAAQARLTQALAMIGWRTIHG